LVDRCRVGICYVFDCEKDFFTGAISEAPINIGVEVEGAGNVIEIDRRVICGRSRAGRAA
jgi:hypothetical protein